MHDVMAYSQEIFTRPLYGRILGGLQDVECYTYALDGETWKKTVTFLHEQAPEPVSGKITRKNIFYDRVGNIVDYNIIHFSGLCQKHFVVED